MLDDDHELYSRILTMRFRLFDLVIGIVFGTIGSYFPIVFTSVNGPRWTVLLGIPCGLITYLILSSAFYRRLGSELFLFCCGDNGVSFGQGTNELRRRETPFS